MLHRYWITFMNNEKMSPLNFGCGITARSWHEAKEMLHEKVFSLFGDQEILNFIEDVDIGILDADHVRTNMGNPACSGVWFPSV